MVSLMEVYSMTDTIPLSPTAQAVRDAVLATYADNIPKDDNLWALDRASVVAALRAAADQMSSHHSKSFLYSIADVLKLQTIADELETQ